MLNECSFIGHLGRDPQITTLESGRKVAQFSIACTERGYKKQNGTEVPERTEWIPCVLWGGLADIAERYLHKGSLAYIKGKFRTRKYTDKNGIDRYTTEIYADSMVLLPSGGGNAAPLPPDVDGGVQAGGASAGAASAQAGGAQTGSASAQAASAGAASAGAASAQAKPARTGKAPSPSPAMQHTMDLLGDAFGAAPTDDLPF